MICCLKKALYGCRQAPRCWNQHFDKWLRKQGFTACVFTPDRGVKEFLENKGRGKKCKQGARAQMRELGTAQLLFGGSCEKLRLHRDQAS